MRGCLKCETILDNQRGGCPHCGSTKVTEDLTKFTYEMRKEVQRRNRAEVNASTKRSYRLGGKGDAQG
jgi:hypothetical protein